MTVQELGRDALIQLKQDLLSIRVNEKEHRGISCGELADADDLVSDEEVFNEYDGFDFTEDDFRE